MDLLLVAWRYLVARPITLISTLSVTVGLAAIVVVDSVMNGFLAEQRSMIRALAPDVSIDVSSLTASECEQVLADVRALEGVASALPRVEAPAMHGEVGDDLGLPGRGAEHFVQLLGIEPDEANPDSAVIDLQHFLTHDRCAFMKEVARYSPGGRCPLRVARSDAPFWFDPGDSFWRGRMGDEYRNQDDLIPVLFGEKLAADFGYSVGTVLTVSTFGGEIGKDKRLRTLQHQFVVVGTFVTRDHHFDLSHALAPRNRLVEFAQLAAPMQEIAVGAADGDETVLRERLRARFSPGRVPSAAIQTWSDRKSLLLGAVENERRVMNVAMFFVVIVATFSLFVTLYQMVRRKTRDVGVMASLGASPLHAGLLFMICGLMITAAGAASGFVAGLALTRWLNPLLDAVERATDLRLFSRSLFQFDQLPIRVDVGRIGAYAVATVLCGTLFTLLPSLRAARLDPVEALRHE